MLFASLWFHGSLTAMTSKSALEKTTRASQDRAKWDSFPALQAPSVFPFLLPTPLLSLIEPDLVFFLHMPLYSFFSIAHSFVHTHTLLSPNGNGSKRTKAHATAFFLPLFFNSSTPTPKGGKSGLLSSCCFSICGACKTFPSGRDPAFPSLSLILTPHHHHKGVRS